MNTARNQPPLARTPLALSNWQNLAEQIADAIVGAIVGGIAAGTLLPGQKLREIALANLLSFCRVPLRDGLKVLEALGIVVSEPHRGKHVAEFDNAKIFQICQARIALEKIAFNDAVAAYKKTRVA